MKSIRTSRRAVGFALLVGAALLSGGCAEELGPVPMPVARVRGVVKEGERPVSGGWIEFIPVGGTIGNLRSTRIRPDGTFDADGVAVGTNAIRLVDVPVESASNVPLFARLRWAGIVPPGDRRTATSAPARLLMRFDTPIRRTIGTDPSAPLEIDVVAEARKFQDDLNRSTAGRPSVTGEGA